MPGGTQTESGYGIAEGLRNLGAVAALVVATVYPGAVSASVVLTLTGRAVARVAVPVAGVPVGPRARDLWPAVERAASAVYPDAEKITIWVVLANGREAWLPVSSSTASASSTPVASASGAPGTGP